MKKIYLLIAGFTFQVEFNKTESEKSQSHFRSHILHHFTSFIVKKNAQKPHMTITLTHYTKPKSVIKQFGASYYVELFEKQKFGKIQTNYGISLLHFQLIIRSCLEELLLKHNGLLLHASANYINNKTCVFFGPSGAGKTTITGFLNQKYRSLADDSIIVRKIGTTYKIYQTPFQEKVTWITKDNSEYDLGKICILRQSLMNKLTPVNKKSILFKHLLTQVWFTEKGVKHSIPIVLNFLSVFNDFYLLDFRKNKPAIIKFLETA